MLVVASAINRRGMDLVGHLRCFVTVADELHFGRAAARLHLTQPALSRTITRLERSLGSRLFVRSSRSVELSGTGQALLREAVELVERADRFAALAARASRGELGTIRAGVPIGFPAAMVAALATAFRERHPSVALELRELEPAVGLPDGVDAALLVPGPDDDAPGAGRGPVLVQGLGLLVAPASALAARREVHLADLERHPLVILPMDQRAWEGPLLTACRRAGYEPPAVHRPQQPEFALGLVLAGEAVAFGDAEVAADSGLRWIPIVGRAPARTLRPAWHGAAGAEARDRGERFAATAVSALCAGGAWRLAAPQRPPAAPSARPGSFA
jgi:DNA-binding transcriptional LysR family regulator